jgi:hypothetical protein
MRTPLLAFVLLLQVSCLARHQLGSFRVLPNSPDYLLRSPDSTDTPFHEVLHRFNHYEAASDWMDLRPWMELRIENAYYKEHSPKRGLDGFLGTEIARYQLRPQGGLRQLSVQSMKQRPADQPPVEQLIHRSQRRFHYYRYYFAIVFKRNAKGSGSALLGSNSEAELGSLAAQLMADPDSVCGPRSLHCVAFPEACSVSVEMEIIVNGAKRTVLWGTLLANVAVRPTYVTLLRPYEGRLIPVALDGDDPHALRLPLLPGDEVNWR